jgi:hypothetical protein
MLVLVLVVMSAQAHELAAVSMVGSLACSVQAWQVVDHRHHQAQHVVLIPVRSTARLAMDQQHVVHSQLGCAQLLLAIVQLRSARLLVVQVARVVLLVVVAQVADWQAAQLASSSQLANLLSCPAMDQQQLAQLAAPMMYWRPWSCQSTDWLAELAHLLGMVMVADQHAAPIHQCPTRSVVVEQQVVQCRMVSSDQHVDRQQLAPSQHAVQQVVAVRALHQHHPCHHQQTRAHSGLLPAHDHAQSSHWMAWQVASCWQSSNQDQ